MKKIKWQVRRKDGYGNIEVVAEGVSILDYVYGGMTALKKHELVKCLYWTYIGTKAEKVDYDDEITADGYVQKWYYDGSEYSYTITLFENK